MITVLKQVLYPTYEYDNPICIILSFGLSGYGNEPSSLVHSISKQHIIKSEFNS